MPRNQHVLYDRYFCTTANGANATTAPLVKALLAFLFVCSISLNAQTQEPLQLFIPVQNKFDETPLQAQRLKLINALPTTKSVHLVRINQPALTTHDLMVSL